MTIGEEVALKFQKSGHAYYDELIEIVDGVTADIQRVAKLDFEEAERTARLNTTLEQRIAQLERDLAAAREREQRLREALEKARDGLVFHMAITNKMHSPQSLNKMFEDMPETKPLILKQIDTALTAQGKGE